MSESPPPSTMMMIDMNEMYYPDSSDAEEAFYEFTPAPSDFITSWCRNGHGLRIDPGADVLYIETCTDDSQTIIRNGHGHPKIDRGVVQQIIHEDQCVRLKIIKPPNYTFAFPTEAVISVHWDMVVGRECSEQHSSLPLALYGTKDEEDGTTHPKSWWMKHRTLEFKLLQNELPGMKNRFLQRVLDEQGLVSESVVRAGTLAAIAFESLKHEVSLQATRERVSFFAAAETMFSKQKKTEMCCE